MKTVFAVLAAAAIVLPSGVSAAIDDSLCVYKTATSQCTPAAICAYQPKAGDSTPAKSCRIRAGASKLPQQIHLAYAGATAGTAMTISWATFDKIADSSVWVGTSASSLTLRTDVTVATASYYSEGDYTLYQNHATVPSLSPNTQYYYKVGSSSNASATSEVSTFTTARSAADTTAFDIAVYGDLGFGTNGELSADYINTLNTNVSFVYHIGDISYADDDFLVASQALGFYYEKVYNKWMNSMAPIMNKVPYMVTVGNHEAECHSPTCLLSSFKKAHLGNYTAYNARFKMPSTESSGVQNMWYSFEYGPMHFTTISSETDYTGSPSNSYTGNKNGNFGDQLTWLEADLKKAAANRANVPWIIVGMHRPIYHRADTDSNSKPTGDSLALQKAFEALFIKYSVDVVFAGHEHSYERHYPTANAAAVKDGVSSDASLYSNPKAPVYIVTGGPGNPEDNKTSGKNGNIPWNVLESAAYGINTVRVTRNSLAIKYVTSTTATQTIVDQFTITKN